MWAEGRFLNVKTGGTYGNQWAVKVSLRTTQINNVSLNREMAREASNQASKEPCLCSGRI